MTYVLVEGGTGRILSASNKNVFGESALDIGVGDVGLNLLEGWYIKDGKPTERPACPIEDEVFFEGGKATFNLGKGTKLHCFDQEFVDLGNGITIEPPSGFTYFQVLVQPPFPFKPKAVTVRLGE